MVSNAKIKKALGIDKLPVRAKDGLKMTIHILADIKALWIKKWSIKYLQRL